MARLTEVKFGDLQADERYKKLERAMKLASLRKRNEKENSLQHLITSPGHSNSNQDSCDGSSTNPPLRLSGAGSEVVSSSNNFKNTLLRKKKIHDDCNARATSSIKNFYDESDYYKDYILMPPPSIDSPYKSTNSNNKVVSKVAKPSARIDRSNIRVENETAEKRQDFKFPGDSGKHADNFATLQGVSTDSTQSKSVKTFVKWRVMLNAQTQLIIKGTLECGTVVRSKHIRRRLTSTNVESAFKHLYCLQGNIVDDKHELPDYVRGKFYDGFPDDWENVYQIWKTYVLQGCNVMFRWPTPIADSDDDLRSEMIDATLRGSTSPKNDASNVTSMDSDCTGDILRPRNSRNVRSESCGKSDSFTQTYISGIAKCWSQEEAVRVQPSTNRCSRDKNDRQQSNGIANCSRGNSETDRLKEKFNVIVNNLNDKHCSQEYITRIIDIFDCLNYVVSYGPTKENGLDTDISRSREYNGATEERNNKVANSSAEYTESEATQLQQHSMDSKCAKRRNSLRRKRSFAEMSNGKNCSSSDSESEIYAGVPKISMERIIRQRGAMLTPRKRKTRRKGMHENYNSSTEKVSNVPLIASECVNGSYAKATRTKRTSGVQLMNDSSVSVTEDENIQRNVDKRLESNHGKRGQWNESSELARDKDAREMQDHFAVPQENLAAVRRSARRAARDSCNEIRDNEREIAGTKRVKTKIAEANCCADVDFASSESDNRYENRLPRQRFEQQLSPRPKSTPSKTTKPTVISSVPIDVEIRKVSAIQDEVETEQFNEKARSRNPTEKQSPVTYSAAKKVNSSLLSDSKQDSEERVQVEAEGGKRSSRANLKLSKDDETADDRKPKLLSAWTPRVLNQSGLHLIFKGNLVNDAGYVVDRNFQTDAVVRRVSSKLIETVHRDLYQLVGELNDSKHDVPRKLLKQCRYDCPARIEQFCQTWHALKIAKLSAPNGAENDPSTSGPDVSVSSKGRRRMAPLNFWNGERVVLRQNDLVYNPGIVSRDSGNKSSFSKSENTTASSPEKLGRSGAKKSEKNKSKELAGKKENGGRRSGERATGKRHARSRGSEPRLEPHAASAGATNARAKQSNARTSSPSKRTSGNYEGADARHQHRVEYTYYQVIQLTDDVLSDDEVSHV